MAGKRLSEASSKLAALKVAGFLAECCWFMIRLGVILVSNCYLVSNNLVYMVMAAELLYHVSIMYNLAAIGRQGEMGRICKPPIAFLTPLPPPFGT